MWFVTSAKISGAANLCLALPKYCKTFDSLKYFLWITWVPIILVRNQRRYFLFSENLALIFLSWCFDVILCLPACIYPILPHKQDVTQRQFFKAVFNRFEFRVFLPLKRWPYLKGQKWITQRDVRFRVVYIYGHTDSNVYQ